MGESIKTVYRHEVPVDDKAHWIPLTSNPRAVATVSRGGAHIVEFWAEHHSDEFAAPRAFRVFGTGHPVPASAQWFGTTARVGGLVWHLYEVYATDEETPR